MNRNTVTVCKIVALMALAVVTIAQASGQKRMVTPQTPSDPYVFGYYSNANTVGAPDAVLRLTNDGENGPPPANMTANIYVFDAEQEMEECCCAEVSANDYLALSVNNNLTNNPLTGAPLPTRGIIKVVSSAGATLCDASSSYVALGGIHGWITHIQAAGAGAFSITEEELKDGDLGAAELTYLQSTCAFVIEEGTGKGKCTVADSGQ